VKFDLAHPTQNQVRDGLISGAIAESIAIPVLLTVFFIDHEPVKWGYIVAALACIVASVVYMALFVVVTKGGSNISAQANVGFVVVCLALSALGFIELGSSNRYGAFTPAVLVGVTLISIIGDRRMRIGIDVFAIVLVFLISWAEGLRGSQLAAMVVVYSSTIVVITWIIARAMGSLSGHLNFRQAIDALNETFEETGSTSADASTDVIEAAFRRGLPLVAEVLPADQVAVFARNGKLARFLPMVTWPGEQVDVSRLAGLPQLDAALRADSVMLDDRYCVIPVG
jgi:hypothetical protein